MTTAQPRSANPRPVARASSYERSLGRDAGGAEDRDRGAVDPVDGLEPTAELLGDLRDLPIDLAVTLEHLAIVHMASVGARTDQRQA